MLWESRIKFQWKKWVKIFTFAYGQDRRGQIGRKISGFFWRLVIDILEKLSNMILLRHHKVCSKFQGELAITESDEDYKRCVLQVIILYMCTKSIEDQFFEGWGKSFIKSHIVGVGFALQMFTRLGREMGSNMKVCVLFRKASGLILKQERFRLTKYHGSSYQNQLDILVSSAQHKFD